MKRGEQRVVTRGDLAALAADVAAFMDRRDWGRYHAPKNVAAALAVEAAELQQLFLWRELDDEASDKRPEIEAEAADVLICLLNFCNRMGIDLGEATREKLAAADQKYPADRVRGRSEKYDEYPEWQKPDGTQTLPKRASDERDDP
jgi:NTP pyrophosphatase (non-canonical NTP hydrolase)